MAYFGRDWNDDEGIEPLSHWDEDFSDDWVFIEENNSIPREVVIYNPIKIIH